MEVKEQKFLQSYFVSYNEHKKELPYYGKAELAIDGFTITCKVDGFKSPEEAVEALKSKIVEAMNRFYEKKPQIMELKKRLDGQKINN